MINYVTTGLLVTLIMVVMFDIKAHYDTRKENEKKFETYTEWLDRKFIEYPNLCTPPMGPSEALEIIQHYVLGAGYYVVDPINTYQCNTIIVRDILLKVSPKFNKEYKEWIRKGNENV